MKQNKKKRLWRARNEETVTLRAMEIWRAWPDFVQEKYQGQTPEALADMSEISGNFLLWLFAHKPEYSAASADPTVRQWIQEIIRLAVMRRILEWKAILYIEHGRDVFADSEVRDQVVGAIQRGEWHLGE